MAKKKTAAKGISIKEVSFSPIYYGKWVAFDPSKIKMVKGVATVEVVEAAPCMGTYEDRHKNKQPGLAELCADKPELRYHFVPKPKNLSSEDLQTLYELKNQ